MIRRNRKRGSVGSAVLRFFIGLLIVILIVIVGVFILNLDKNEGRRPYVVTGSGAPAPIVTLPPEADVLPEATPEPVMTTPEPTATPTPAPTPEPTPTATAIPKTEMSLMLKEDQFRLPAPSEDGAIGVTGCYVSPANGYSVMELTGYGYANLDYFDGEQCGTYVVVTSLDTGRAAAYLAVNKSGISGVRHVSATCKNPSLCDWRCYIDVSGYEPGMYSLGLALSYKNGEDNEYRYYKFGSLQSFTVNDGEVIIPVTLTGQE